MVNDMEITDINHRIAIMINVASNKVTGGGSQFGLTSDMFSIDIVADF